MNMEGCPIEFAQSSHPTSFTHPTLPKISKEESQPPGGFVFILLSNMSMSCLQRSSINFYFHCAKVSWPSTKFPHMSTEPATTDRGQSAVTISMRDYEGSFSYMFVKSLCMLGKKLVRPTKQNTCH